MRSEILRSEIKAYKNKGSNARLWIVLSAIVIVSLAYVIFAASNCGSYCSSLQLAACA